MYPHIKIGSHKYNVAKSSVECMFVRCQVVCHMIKNNAGNLYAQIYRKEDVQTD
jgi:hypothetical protein